MVLGSSIKIELTKKPENIVEKETNEKVKEIVENVKPVTDFVEVTKTNEKVIEVVDFSISKAVDK